MRVPDSQIPLVSVVIATYNRSYVLRHAVASVLASVLQDFEVIVVGDCCTDDSEAVVASFDDPRVRFVNLEEHCGDQSAPNNLGCMLSRGEFIAFLNHDDLYLPDHIGSSAAFLRTSGADLVWTPMIWLEPATQDQLAGRQWPAALLGVSASGEFDAMTFVSASSVMFRRDLVKRVGPWRRGGGLYVSPSQDWLYRAACAGAHLAFLPHPSSLCINSGHRPGSYANRSSLEHEVYGGLVGDTSFRTELLEAAVVRQAREIAGRGPSTSIRLLLRAMGAPFRAVCRMVGLHPMSAHMLVRLVQIGRAHV